MISSHKILPTHKLMKAHCAHPDITSRHARERVRSDIETAVTCNVLHICVAFIEGATRRTSERSFSFSSAVAAGGGGGEGKTNLAVASIGAAQSKLNFKRN